MVAEVWSWTSCKQSCLAVWIIWAGAGVYACWVTEASVKVIAWWAKISVDIAEWVVGARCGRDACWISLLGVGKGDDGQDL